MKQINLAGRLRGSAYGHFEQPVLIAAEKKEPCSPYLKTLPCVTLGIKFSDFTAVIPHGDNK